MWQMKQWPVHLLAAYFISKAPTEMFMFNPSQSNPRLFLKGLR
jgi:hypothetical protein